MTASRARSVAFWRLHPARSQQLNANPLRVIYSSFETEHGYQELRHRRRFLRGKTTVCDELQRRGYHAIHGDRELAYWGDPKTGQPVTGCAGAQRTWMWNVAKVSALVADQTHAATFFCGGSRNADRFIDVWDGVFVLAIDLDTLNRRLAARPEDAWGGSASEGEAFARFQHATNEGLPTNAIIIDATAPLSRIVDTILEHANVVSP